MKKLSVRTKKFIAFAMSIVVIVSTIAIVNFVNAEGENGIPTGSSKEYIEYVVDAIVSGNQEKFTILEVVPAIDMGEMRYYAAADEVEERLENLSQSDLASQFAYMTTSNDSKNKWLNPIWGNTGMGNFGFFLKQSSYDGNYTIKCENIFLGYTLPAYYNELQDKIEVKTVEANDLTVEDVYSADMISLASGVHDDGTLKIYKYLFGENCTSYDANGNNAITGKAASYNQYEKVENTYVTRDINWDSAVAILEMNKSGKLVNTSEGEKQLRVPIVIDNQNTSSLTDDSNYKKLYTAIRMLNPEQYSVIKPYIGSSEEVKNSQGIVTGILDFDQKFEVDTAKTVNIGNPTWEIMFRNSSLIDNNELLIQYAFAYSDYLTEDVWTYNGSSVMIPCNKNTMYVNTWSHETFSKNLGKAQALASEVLSFLLGAQGSVTPIQNLSVALKVLEIQPCNDFTYNSFDNIKALGTKMGMNTSKWTESNYKENLDVTCITTNGFNGMTNELISTYDVIILGENIGILTKSNGTTLYNDTSLKGYRYLAFGDLIKVSTTLQGYQESDYTKVSNQKVLKNVYNVFKQNYYNNDALFANTFANARLSGNDITANKLSELKDYANAGKIVVVGDILNVNNKCAYPTSNIYSFLEYVNTNEDYSRKVISMSEVDKIYYLYGDNLPQIKMLESPQNIQYNKDGAILDSVINTTGILDFKFNISGKKNTHYSVKLIVDKNGDGIYRGVYENLTNDDNELYYVDYDVLLDATGNKDYSIKIELPDKYTGLFAWRVEVTELTNGTDKIETLYTNCVDGAVAVRQEEKDIKVLQIVPNIYSSKSVTLNLNTDTSKLSGATDEQKSVNTLFNSLLNTASDVVGYNVTIDSIDTTEFAKNNGVRYNSDDKSTNPLVDYDMIILGFADLYGGDDISNDMGVLDCIQDFIDEGKSVLFTHDTISYSVTENFATENGAGAVTDIKSNYVQSFLGDGAALSAKSFYPGGNFWCYNLNKYFRDVVGMNRYGILSDNGVKNVPTKSNGTGITELQGLNNMVLYRYALVRTFKTTEQWSGIFNYYPYSTYQNGSRTNNYNSLFVTTQVDRLNEGQVTMYPFSISETLKVAETHAQWYQLDMEDEDIVVWYTLGDDGNTALNSAYYADTKNDAGNNYYIYSKDNITYSGAGHSIMSSEVELRLFVNTIIKAVSGGNYLPEVRIVNGSKATDGYNIYVDGYEVEEDYKIVFRANDADLATFEMTNDMNRVGRFAGGSIVWLKNGVEVVIKSYSNGEIKNEVDETLRLMDCKSKMSAADYQMMIEQVREGKAQFIVTVKDSRGAQGTVNASFKLRKLYQLD